MPLSVAVTVRQQSTQCMRQEFEPDWKRRRTVEQIASFGRRQTADAFEVKGNRFLERVEDLFERATLDRDIEI
jgi:hypothetical protein